MIPEENLFSNGKHPDDEEIAQVAEGKSSPWMTELILEHTDKCERCRFTLSELARTVNQMPDLKLDTKSDPPLELKIYVECESCGKQVVKSDDICPECGNPINGKELSDKSKTKMKREPRPWKRQGDTTFFWLACSMLLLSMILSKYLVQFLVFCLFFSVFAVLDYSHRNLFSPLIKAWKEGNEEKAEEALKEIKERFKTG